MEDPIQISTEQRVYPIPEGLHEILTDIGREVLRAQPEQILIFIAEYLEALLITREAAKDAIQIVDDALDNELMKYCVTLKTSPERVLWAVHVIQRALRKYFARKSLKALRKSMGSTQIEKGAAKSLTPELTQDAETFTSSFLLAHGITYLEGHYAAIVIQKAWRGYLARKVLKEKRSPHRGKDLSEGARPDVEHYAPAWANSWLTMFENVEPPVAPFVKGKMFPEKSPSNVYLPRREITANRHVLKTMFSGEMGDDDQVCREYSSTIISQAPTFTQPINTCPDEYHGENLFVERFGESRHYSFQDENDIATSAQLTEMSSQSVQKITPQASSTTVKSLRSLGGEKGSDQRVGSLRRFESRETVENEEDEEEDEEGVTGTSAEEDDTGTVAEDSELEDEELASETVRTDDTE